MGDKWPELLGYFLPSINGPQQQAPHPRVHTVTLCPTVSQAPGIPHKPVRPCLPESCPKCGQAEWRGPPSRSDGASSRQASKASNAAPHPWSQPPRATPVLPAFRSGKQSQRPGFRNRNFLEGACQDQPVWEWGKQGWGRGKAKASLGGPDAQTVPQTYPHLEVRGQPLTLCSS